MREGIDRRVMLAALLPLASCSAPLALPTLHFKTSVEARAPFFDTVRIFARGEGYVLNERVGAFGTIPFVRFIMYKLGSSILLETDVHAPLASLDDVNTFFYAKIGNSDDPMPWAMNERGLQALSQRFQNALTATPGVEVVEASAG